MTASGAVVTASWHVPSSRRALDIFTRHNGFSLLEAVVSSGVLVAIAISLVQLVAMSVASVRASSDETSALLLAVQKMEQLRGVAWTYDRSGRRLSDLSTDMAAASPRFGGFGLAASPPDSLIRSVPGYADFLDRHGRWIGSGSSPPSGTVFVRRWAIASADRVADPDTLGLMVVVVSMRLIERLQGRSLALNDPGVVWLLSARSRR